MAITKIKSRNSNLKQAMDYTLNGDKTDDYILAHHHNCDPGFAYQQMMDEKQTLYNQLADIDRDIRVSRKTLKLCQEIEKTTPKIETELEQLKTEREVKNHDNRRR